MARPTNELPVKFSRMKAGKKYWSARFMGREITLGPDGSPQVAQRWASLLHQIASSPGRAFPLRGNAVLLPELFAKYLASDESPTARDSRRWIEVALITLTSSDTDAFPGGPDYTELEASELSAAMFKAWRKWLANVAAGGQQRYTRDSVRKAAAAVVNCYSWGSTEGLVEQGVVAALREVQAVPVPGAKLGRKRHPVCPDLVAATLPYLGPTAAAAVQILLLTGARPNEVLTLTPSDIIQSGVHRVPGFGQCDLDTTGLWCAVRSQHKNASKGKGRVVWFPEAAQKILLPLLDRPPSAALFSPAEDQIARAEARRRNRKSKVTPSQVSRAKPDPARRPGAVWTPHALAKSIAAACRRAGTEKWTPYQLRHTAKNTFTRKYGTEAARLLLGHEKTDTTDLYGGRDYQLLANAINGERGE